MKIDVTERVEIAKRLTREWAERAGYKQPAKDDVEISKKANDLRRVLSVSDFGCQSRNVRALLEVLIDEKIPEPERSTADYQFREPFVTDIVLVPLRAGSRAGLVTRVSGPGNAGLRSSNGSLQEQHYQQYDVRPATDEEIETYFAEFFGLVANPDDAPGAIDTSDEIPF